MHKTACQAREGLGTTTIHRFAPGGVCVQVHAFVITFERPSKSLLKTIIYKEMQHYQKLKELVEELGVDIQKFEEHQNKTAGTRARGVLQEVKVVAQALRQEIQETKNKLALKGKK